LLEHAKEMLKAAQDEGLLQDEPKICSVRLCGGEVKEETTNGKTYLVCQKCNAHNFNNSNND